MIEDCFPNEKRRSPRVGGAIVEYYLGNNATEVKKAFIKDICIHGIGIYVPEVIPPDAIVTMDIYLFGSDIPLPIKGRIVWNRIGEYLGHHNVGIEFTEISEEDKQRLADYIQDALDKKEEEG